MGLAGRVILLWGWRRALVAFLAGALAVLALPPFDFPAVCFISFPILVWLLDGAVAERGGGLIRRLAPAFFIGWWFGFGYFLGGLWWIGNALLVEGDSFAWALPLAMVGLPAFLALFYALACALARSMWSDGLGRIAALAFAFGVVEWLRSFAFTGFPWNAIGYAAMPTPLLMQSASLVGLIGMNALAVFVFASPALLASPRGRRTGLALAAILLLAHLGFGAYRLNQPPAADGQVLTVRVVQPAVDQTEKWDAAVRDRIFKTLLDLTTAPPDEGKTPPSLVVWPETSVPFLFTDRPDALAALGDALGEGQMLLAGAIRSEGEGGPDPRYYNSVIAINDRGEIVGASDKVHLVPFGEYLPFEGLLSRLGVKKVVPLPQSFSSGAGPQLLSLPGGLKALPLICYEAIFPQEIAAHVGGSDIMVNVTNDAWYGDTPGPYQHFRQAQLRAVEFGRPLVRVANNGISAVIGPDGRVMDGFALDAVGHFDVSIPVARNGGLSWSATTYGAAVLLAFFLLVCAMLIMRSRSQN
ncbi:MAG: apolipoprotein N-acyltransferase [Mesorhizobium sp.]